MTRCWNQSYSLKTKLTCFVTILLFAATLYSVHWPLQHHKNTCTYPPSHDPVFHTGIAVLDYLTCMFSAFFNELFVYPRIIGESVAAFTFNLFVAILLVIAFESTRASTTGLLSSPIFIGFLSQFCGVSLVLPLLWLSSWFVNYPTSHTPRTPLIESKVLYRMSFFVFVFYLTTMLLQFGDREMLSIWINVFTYAPLLIALSWFPRASAFSHDASSSKVAIKLYRIGAVILFVKHVHMLYHVFTESGIPPMETLKTIFSWITTPIVNETKLEAPAMFICVEGISLIFTFGVWIFHESEIFSLIYFFIECVFFGGGSALLLFAARREKKFFEKQEKLKK